MKRCEIFVLRLVCLVCSLLCSGVGTTLMAAPLVESYALVATTRFGRTAFDYTYRPLVRVDSHSYRGAAFTVTSKNPATQIVKGRIALGDIDAGNVVLAPDTFTIRQDRLVAFDRMALEFAFSGDVVSKDPGTSGLSVGDLSFVEVGGRPGHELLLPIQGADPPAGESMIVAVDIYGPSVSGAMFRLLDAHGLPLGSGPLTRLPDAHAGSPRHFGKVEVPIQPFRIEVSAVGLDTRTFFWVSRTYAPSGISLRILAQERSKSWKHGEAIPMILRLVSSASAASGVFIVRMWLPSDWGGNTGPWTINLEPGAVSEIPLSVTTPSTGTPFARYTVTAEAAPAIPAKAKPVLSSLQIEVE